MTKDTTVGVDPKRSIDLLWGDAEPGRRRSAGEDADLALDRAGVDLDGLDRQQRLLGRDALELGVSAMSIYTYVPSKAELVELMFDRVLGEMAAPPSADVGWREALTDVARERWRMSERHPWMLDLAMNQDWPALEGLLMQIAQQQVDALPDAQKAAVGDLDILVRQQVASQLQIFQSPWYQFFLHHEPADDLAKVTVPVLGIFGGNDTQVDAEQNSTALQAALEQAGNQDVTIQVLPTANHLFQDAQSGGVDEYAALSPQLMPEFLETLSQWLLARVQLP